jgi:hypothetical protein
MDHRRAPLLQVVAEYHERYGSTPTAVLLTQPVLGLIAADPKRRKVLGLRGFQSGELQRHLRKRIESVHQGDAMETVGDVGPLLAAEHEYRTQLVALDRFDQGGAAVSPAARRMSFARRVLSAALRRR